MSQKRFYVFFLTVEKLQWFGPFKILAPKFGDSAYCPSTEGMGGDQSLGLVTSVDTLFYFLGTFRIFSILGIKGV